MLELVPQRPNYKERKMGFFKKVFGFSCALSTFATFADAGLVDDHVPFLFSREGDSVAITRCAPYTVLDNSQDCAWEPKGIHSSAYGDFSPMGMPSIVRPGTKNTHIAIQVFKNGLRWTLKSSPWPGDQYSTTMQEKVRSYKLGANQNAVSRLAQLRRQQSETQTALDNIRAYINRYGQTPKATQREASLEGQLATIEREIEQKSPLASSVRELDQRIDGLVENVISSAALESVYSAKQTSFEYTLLRSFLRRHSLSPWRRTWEVTSMADIYKNPDFRKNQRRWENRRYGALMGETSITEAIRKRLEEGFTWTPKWGKTPLSQQQR